METNQVTKDIVNIFNYINFECSLEEAKLEQCFLSKNYKYFLKGIMTIIYASGTMQKNLKISLKLLGNQVKETRTC